MKPVAFLWRILLALIVLAGLAQYWLVERSHEVAGRIKARLIPYGELRYERLWPNLWGTGRVWGLSFQPEGLLRLNLQTPPGFRVHAQELRIEALLRSDDGGVEQLRGQLLGIEIPVSAHLSPTGTAGGPAQAPLPTLHELGYSSLRLDLAFSIRHIAEAQLAVVRLDASGAGLGRARFSAQLEGGPEIFDRAPDQILLRKAGLEFADGGLLSRLKQVAAARSDVSLAVWEQAMIGRIDRLQSAGRWRWDQETLLALRQAIREPGYWRADIDPPDKVFLRNIRLYPTGDWPRQLGFTLATEGAFDPSAPAP